MAYQTKDDIMAKWDTPERRQEAKEIEAIMNFAEKFKAARKVAGLTQQGLQDQTGIPRRTVQDWEAGKMEPPEWCQNLVLEKLEQLKSTLKK